MLKQILKSEY